jgi:hypothetical protein
MVALAPWCRDQLTHALVSKTISPPRIRGTCWTMCERLGEGFWSTIQSSPPLHALMYPAHEPCKSHEPPSVAAINSASLTEYQKAMLEIAGTNPAMPRMPAKVLTSMSHHILSNTTHSM